MPVTEAQKRAVAKYNREKVRAFNMRFYPTDADILAHFEAQPNKQRYLKDLIRADMEARRGQQA